MDDTAPPNPEPHVHHYATQLSWTGSTGVGYAGYERRHELRAAPAEQSLQLASDPAFGGDPALLNPEQLLLAAASSCQLLSFLAVAARARLDVVGYTDHATAVMPEDDRPIRLTRIDLRPVITVRAGSDRFDDDRLDRLVQTGHRECFVASSLRTEIVVTPTFVRAG